jgi:hypothetical protein
MGLKKAETFCYGSTSRHMLFCKCLHSPTNFFSFAKPISQGCGFGVGLRQILGGIGVGKNVPTPNRTSISILNRC